MNQRTTTKIRPAGAALRALLALVLAVGLMPLPAFQPQSAFAAAFEKTQEITLTDTSKTQSVKANVTLSVDKTTVAPGGTITATWTFDLGEAEAKWHWGSLDTTGDTQGTGVWLERTGASSAARATDFFDSVSVAGDGISQDTRANMLTEIKAARIKATWTENALGSLRKVVAVETIKVKDSLDEGAVFNLKPSVNYVYCNDDGSGKETGHCVYSNGDSASLTGWDLAVTIGEESGSSDPETPSTTYQNDEKGVTVNGAAAYGGDISLSDGVCTVTPKPLEAIATKDGQSVPQGYVIDQVFLDGVALDLADASIGTATVNADGQVTSYTYSAKDKVTEAGTHSIVATFAYTVNFT